jgi:hypothetical protein
MILEEKEKQKKKELWEALKRQGLEVLEDLKKQKIQLENMKRKQEEKMLEVKKKEKVFNLNLCTCGDCFFCFSKVARVIAEKNTRCRNAEEKKLDPNYKATVCYGCDGSCDICDVEEKDFNEILHLLLEEKKKENTIFGRDGNYGQKEEAQQPTSLLL